jgi:PAS domain-containing protein
MKNNARRPGALCQDQLAKFAWADRSVARRPGCLASSSTARLVEDLRHSQAELEIQNKALRYSQTQAEGASERFVTLFSNVPLALMVVDERGQILENNARTLDLLRQCLRTIRR